MSSYNLLIKPSQSPWASLLQILKLLHVFGPVIGVIYFGLHNFIRILVSGSTPRNTSKVITMTIIKNITIFPSRNKRFAVPELRTSASSISSSSTIYLFFLPGLWYSVSQPKERLTVFQNRVLSRIFWWKREEVCGSCWQLTVHTFHSLPNIIKVRRVGYEWHVSCIRQKERDENCM